MFPFRPPLQPKSDHVLCKGMRIKMLPIPPLVRLLLSRIGSYRCEEPPHPVLFCDPSRDIFTLDGLTQPNLRHHLKDTDVVATGGVQCRFVNTRWGIPECDQPRSTSRG